jgi:hypothetical protein
VYFDFAAAVPVVAANMSDVETSIRSMLVSDDVEQVRNGLANVIYWGYAQIAYRDVRVTRFRVGVTQDHLSAFRRLVEGGVTPTLAQIAMIGMPQYSGISFISKVLTFLDPIRFCVLDKQLAKLASGPGCRALHRLTMGTQIQITSNNESVYNAWRAECGEISTRYFGGRRRVVDIERGFFQLVQSGNLDLAQHTCVAA